MKRLLLLLFVVGVLGPTPQFCDGALHAQEQGNPEHKEPPPGTYCTYAPTRPEARACQCHRTCGENEDGTVYTVEDPQCRHYCFKDFCRCPSECP